MPYTTPPTFVNGQIVSAAQLNILSDDIEFLNGVMAGPNIPFQSVTWDTNSGEHTWYMRYRHRYLHYSFQISSDAADDVKIYVNGSLVFHDGAPAQGFQTSYVDLNSLGLIVGTWYPVRFEYDKQNNSVCTVNYLIASASTSL